MNIARLGDRCRGSCAIHGPQSGTIITASPKHFLDNIGVARIGDKVLADCGHQGTVITGSQKQSSENLNVARVGDLVTGIYRATIITGSQSGFSE